MNRNTRSMMIWMVFMSIFFIFLYLFNSTLEYKRPDDIQTGIVYEKGRVVNVLLDNLAPDPDFPDIKIGKQKFEIEIMTGEHKDKLITVNNFVGRLGDNKPGKVGTEYVIYSFDDFTTTLISNYSREKLMYILIFLFLLVVVVFGHFKGFKSILALVFTIICIIFLFIPMIIRGVNTITASCIVVVFTTSVTLLSLNGWCKKTFAAAVSCILCTMLAGVIAYIFGLLTHVNTLNTEQAQELLYIAQGTHLKVNDLLFAGILFSSLGAITDTTMSIASSISEIKILTPNIKEKQLFKSGMNIGKDIMGTMTDTLILVFTGSSINLLILFFMYNMPYIQIINLDLLVIEIIQGLSGSIAVALSIPITAYVASKIFGKNKETKNYKEKAVKL